MSVSRLALSEESVGYPRSISGLVGADQRRLDDILDEVDECVGSGRFFQAARLYDEFLSGLERHMEMEEEVLFPLYASLVQGGDGVVADMATEHMLIRVVAEEVAESLRLEDVRAFSDGIEELHAVMDGHDLREEQGVYPRLDEALLARDTRDSILQKLLAY